MNDRPFTHMRCVARECQEFFSGLETYPCADEQVMFTGKLSFFGTKVPCATGSVAVRSLAHGYPGSVLA